MRALGALLAALTVAAAIGAAQAAPIRVVAAESVYGDVARQVGREQVNVVSILNNPAQDPHLFDVAASVARAVSAARIVIYNGAAYDPWMDRLLVAARSPDRQQIVAASLVGLRAGDNPHIWYDPATISAVAGALSAALAADDPADAADFAQRRDEFVRSLGPVRDAIRALRAAYGGIQVTATEPVFAYMFAALGMRVRNVRFQTAVMNGTEPSASDVAAFETSLRQHDVKLLLYNSQVSDPLTERMRGIAEAAGIPVVGVPETEPPGTVYQTWILDELRRVSDALSTTQ